MLWIALHLPLLSLESFAATLLQQGAAADKDPLPAIEPLLALMDRHGIVSANAAAQALGVKPGLKRATALALVPQLTLGQADPVRDAQALTAVAHAALAFTPSVTLQPDVGARGRLASHASGGAPGGASGDASSSTSANASAHTSVASHTVLLEVRASLRFFGGLDALLQRLHTALAPLGHHIHTVSAPTALGAALLARVHSRLHCADVRALGTALAAAPVWLLGPGREHWEALQGMGLRTLGDLQRLPRAGLARRFGESLLSELDRALGIRPDPRVAMELPPTFESRLELFARADTTEQVLYGASVLLARLLAWLSAQHAFVRRFTLLMHHEKRLCSDAPQSTSTRLDIALAQPSRDAAHLLVLLRERLAQVQLPAPTLELQLQASDISRQPPPNTELFPTPNAESEGLTRLIERLQARLGPAQVQRLVRVQDHRPERASEMRAVDAADFKSPVHAAIKASKRASMSPSTNKPGHAAASRHARASANVVCAPPDAGVRPVWLLHPAEPLPERQSRPWLQGQPLQLLSGPERIEAGWWDVTLAERDYFIAQTPEGALVWVYRARLPLSAAAGDQGWFLQGRFA